MTDARPLRIAIVAGEESGDLLGSDLVAALRAATGRPVTLSGVGGRHLQAQGLRSLFDSSHIALMGVSAILRDLPRLIGHIGRVARAVVNERPDCLITIDSPEFSLRVARKVRAADASIPIVHYVCPSVWAWRPARASAMRPHVDRVLCLLPFEPDALAQLGGPPGTFVGHRLMRDPNVLAAADAQARRSDRTGRRRLLVLPGSRRSEVDALLEPFGNTVGILSQRGVALDVTVPTVPKLARRVQDAVYAWPQNPRVVVDTVEKWAAFGQADAALIASGTVSLELALCGVPSISCYRLDSVGRLIQGMVTVWSASLPNIIVDRPVIPEFYNDYVRPPYLARNLEALFEDGPLRMWQIESFAEVRRRMETPKPSGEIAAAAVLDQIGAHRAY